MPLYQVPELSSGEICDLWLRRTSREPAAAGKPHRVAGATWAGWNAKVDTRTGQQPQQRQLWANACFDLFFVEGGAIYWIYYNILNVVRQLGREIDEYWSGIDE